MSRTTLAFLAALFCAGVIAAEDFDFERHDTNGDGYLTETEWSDAGQAETTFNEIDGNGDGYLEQDEVLQADVPAVTPPVEDGDVTPTTAGSDAQRIEALDNRDDAVVSSTERRSGADRDDAVVSSTERAEDAVDAPASPLEQAAVARNGAAAAPVADDEPPRALGRDAPEPPQGAAITQIDANQDGRVSREEAEQDAQIGANFVLWDLNQDGYLEQREVDQGRRENGTPAESRDEVEEFDQAAAAAAGADAGGETQQQPVNFDEADLDGDGRLSREEVGAESSISAEFDVMDTNSDGYLDAEEVTYDPAERTPADAASADAVSFDDYDADGDGRLSRDEAADDTYMNANFDAWDSDQDGYLVEDEVSEGWLDDARVEPTRE